MFEKSTKADLSNNAIFFVYSNFFMLSALLSSAYFAPIQWFQKLNRYDLCLIEQHDHFVKQTYRNRCVIATANGQQTLSIPVEKFDNKNAKCAMFALAITIIGDTNIGMHYFRHTAKVLSLNITKTIFAHSSKENGNIFRF